jgi:alkylated DNA repair dioxygenase AlkB
MPGQGISAHVDSLAYGDTIQCYTLGSGAMMRFTPVEGGNNERQELYVETCSLYRMTGDARYRWKHEFAARKSDIVEGKKIQRGRRVSVTLRWVPVPVK